MALSFLKSLSFSRVDTSSPASAPSVPAQARPASARVIDSWQGGSGRQAIDAVAGTVKTALSGLSAADVSAMMKAHYRQMRLLDASGAWTVPGAAGKAQALLPDNLDAKDMAAFVDKVTAVAKNNPYLMSFFADVQHGKLDVLSAKVATEGKAVMASAVAYAMVQDRMTKAMYDDPAFLKACTTHWEQAAATDPKFKDKIGPFERLKLSTVRIPIHSIIEQHDAGRVNGRFPRVILPLNIAEATVTEAAEGGLGNAKAGLELMKSFNSFTRYDARDGCQPARFAPDGCGIEMGIPLAKQWADLYATWNMAFVARRCSNFPFYMAKLLIPQVNDYKDAPQVYMYNRVIALQMQLYSTVFGKVDNSSTEHLDWRDPELTRIWSRANAKSAAAYEKALDNVNER